MQHSQTYFSGIRTRKYLHDTQIQCRSPTPLFTVKVKPPQISLFGLCFIYRFQVYTHYVALVMSCATNQSYSLLARFPDSADSRHSAENNHQATKKAEEARTAAVTWQALRVARLLEVNLDTSLALLPFIQLFRFHFFFDLCFDIWPKCTYDKRKYRTTQ